MGVSTSPIIFSLIFSTFTKAIIFHFPELFGGIDNLDLLYSFIDDFMAGACSHAHAMTQIAVLKMFGEMLGIKFLNSKMEYPSSEQCLLGLTLNTLFGAVYLKTGKKEKFAVLVRSLLDSSIWKLKDIQSLCGNLIWLSLIIPKLNAFANPFIFLQSHFYGSNQLEPKKHPGLHRECVSALNFLLPVVEVDPSIHIKKFLGKLKPLRNLPYSDASGWETAQSNKTPGKLGCVFFNIKLHWCFAVSWHALVRKLCFDAVDAETFMLPWARPHGDPTVSFPSIAFLEFSALMLNVIHIFLLSPTQRLWFERKWVKLASDNQNTVSWVNNGRCPFFPFSRLSEFVIIAELILESSFSAVYVPSKKQLADPITRGQSTVYMTAKFREPRSKSKFRAKRHRPLKSKVLKCQPPPEPVVALFCAILTKEKEPAEFLENSIQKIAAPRGRLSLHVPARRTPPLPPSQVREPSQAHLLLGSRPAAKSESHLCNRHLELGTFFLQEGTLQKFEKDPLGNIQESEVFFKLWRIPSSTCGPQYAFLSKSPHPRGLDPQGPFRFIQSQGYL